MNVLQFENDLALLNYAISHTGVKGMEWYKNKADRYQRHAKYAMGRPDPNAARRKTAEKAGGAGEVNRLKSEYAKALTTRNVKKQSQLSQELKAKLLETTRNRIMNDMDDPDARKLAMVSGKIQSVLDGTHKGSAAASTAPLLRQRDNLTEKIEKKAIAASDDDFRRIIDDVQDTVEIDRVNAIKRGLPYADKRFDDGSHSRIPPIANPRTVVTLGPLSFRVGITPVDVVTNSVRVFGTMNATIDVSNTFMAVVSAAIDKGKRRKAPVDEKTGLHLKTKGTSLHEDALAVNPLYKTLATKPEVNALSCVAAMEMRQRGYDVAVKYKPFESFKKGNQHKIERQFTDTKIERVKDGDITKALSKQPDGSRGVFFFNWSFSPLSGHCLYYTVKNGKVSVVDPQSGAIPSDSFLKNTFRKQASNVSFARLDASSIDIEAIKEAIK